MISCRSYIKTREGIGGTVRTITRGFDRATDLIYLYGYEYPYMRWQCTECPRCTEENHIDVPDAEECSEYIRVTKLSMQCEHHDQCTCGQWAKDRCSHIDKHPCTPQCESIYCRHLDTCVKCIAVIESIETGQIDTDA